MINKAALNKCLCSHYLISKWPNDDVIKWKHFLRYWPSVRENPPANSGFPSQRLVMQNFDVFLICAWINGWLSNRDTSDLRRHHAHCDVIVMLYGKATDCLYTLLEDDLEDAYLVMLQISHHIIIILDTDDIRQTDCCLTWVWNWQSSVLLKMVNQSVWH